MASPRKVTMPRSGARGPEMTRRSVDFPAPFVPSSATTSPGGDAEVDVEEHLHWP